MLCSGCKKDLPIEAFAYQNEKKRKRQANCKACRHEYYMNNRSRTLVQNDVYNKGRRRLYTENLIRYFAEHPCVDCGETDPVVLQFDHVRGKKLFNISCELGRHSWEKTMAEIAKCDVRCANCHVRVTSIRRGALRVTLGTG